MGVSPAGFPGPAVLIIDYGWEGLELSIGLFSVSLEELIGMSLAWVSGWLVWQTAFVMEPEFGIGLFKICRGAASSVSCQVPASAGLLADYGLEGARVKYCAL